MRLKEKARYYLQNIEKYHFGREGFLNYRERIGTTPWYNRQADQTAWTGLFLAAEALRYHITKKTGAKANCERMLNFFELQHKIFGLPLLSRCIHKSAGPYPGENLDRKHFQGTGEYSDYRLAADVSPDQYTYAFHGMALAWMFFPDFREQIRRIVIPMLDRIKRDDYDIHDFDGEETTHGSLRVWLGPVPASFYSTLKYAWFMFGELIDPGRYKRTFWKFRLHLYDWLITWPLVGLGRFKKASNVFYLNTNLFTLLIVSAKLKNAHIHKRAVKGAGFLWDSVGSDGVPPICFLAAHFLEGKDRKEAIEKGMRTLNNFPDDKKYYIDIKEEKKRAYVVSIRERPVSTVYWKSSSFEREFRNSDLKCSEKLEYTGVDFLYAYWLSKLVA